MRFIPNLIEVINQNNSNAKLIVGGYEVSSKTIDHLVEEYNSIDHFIIGFAEESLYRIIIGVEKSKIVTTKVKNSDIPPIYSNRVIEASKDNIVRLETKRGCPYNCSFCSYKNNDQRQITLHDTNKVINELTYLNSVGVKKVNIIDPIFTIKNYRDILEHLISIEFKPQLSIQCKFEVLNSLIVKDETLLDKLSSLDVVIEFGLQSTSKKVLSRVDRINNQEIIKSVMDKLEQHSIRYEVSIIRGLPGETVESFYDMIHFMKTYSNAKYIIYPLTLLTNTPLYDLKEEYGLKTYTQNGLEYVVESDTYSYSDYLKMCELEG